MSSTQRPRVLDVGQCNPDHSSIRALLLSRFDVEVDRVMFVDEAIEAMQRQSYALVLVNRQIFADGSEGMELIRRFHEKEAAGKVPIMMVSNYPDAQAAAVARGAQPGFGKDHLFSQSTVDRLAEFLPLKP